MKTETSMKRIVNNYRHIFSCGYCDLQMIFRRKTPLYYNAGVYGWNCDIYVDFARDIAISTGYRNTRGKTIPAELIKKYNDIAEAISRQAMEKPFKSYEEITAMYEENAENFLNELLKI